MIVRLLAVLFLLVALLAVYFWAAVTWSYSSGERAGWVQKFSKKGWVCKTWEGELALVSLPGSVPEKFYFTIHDAAVAARVTQHVGKRVALHYEEKVGLPSSCFGETRYFVSDVTLSDEIPIATGVVVPAQAASAPAPAPQATPATAPITVPAPSAPTAPAPAPAPPPAASQ